jgi:hypothetical protein
MNKSYLSIIPAAIIGFTVGFTSRFSLTDWQFWLSLFIYSCCGYFYFWIGTKNE